MTPPGGPMNVGWIGHPLTSHYLPIVAPALRQPLARHRFFVYFLCP